MLKRDGLYVRKWYICIRNTVVLTVLKTSLISQCSIPILKVNTRQRQRLVILCFCFNYIWKRCDYIYMQLFTVIWNTFIFVCLTLIIQIRVYDAKITKFTWEISITSCWLKYFNYLLFYQFMFIYYFEIKLDKIYIRILNL